MAERVRDQSEQPVRCSGETRRSRIRDDLERLGVAREFSYPVAERLAVIAPDFSSAEYSAVLDGVAAAYGVHREDPEASSDAVEIGRLMQGFASEHRKVDEGLRILCAYAERMQRRAVRSTRNLH